MVACISCRFFRELITSEESKLEVTRSLLDLKLEHSKLQEKFESDRYALTTDLLAAKNEVVELEMRRVATGGIEETSWRNILIK